MVDGAMPKPLGDIAGVFLAAMVGGGILLGWLNNRGRRDRGAGTSGDGMAGDDGLHYGASWGYHAGDDGDISGDAEGGDDGH